MAKAEAEAKAIAEEKSRLREIAGKWYIMNCF